MPYTQEDVLQALRNADAAGNKEDAQKLAIVLRDMMAQEVPAEIPATPAPAPQTGFWANVKGSAERIKGDVGAVGAAMGVSGAEQFAAAQRKKADEMAAIAPLTESPWEAIKGMAGASLPYMAAPVVAAFAAPEAVVGGGLLTAAEIFGGGASAAQFFGSNLSRQLQEGKAGADLNVAGAAAAAPFQAALDVFGMRMIPGIRGILGKAGVDVTAKEAEQIAKQGVLQAYGTGAIKTAGTEGLTEAAQQVLERLQAGLKIGDPEARKEYFDSFIGGAVLGGALHMPGTALERMGRKEVPEAVAPAVAPAAPEAIPEPTLAGAAAPEATPEERQRGFVEKMRPPVVREPQAAAPTPEVAPQQMLPNVQQMMDQLQAARPELDAIKEQARDAAAKGDTAAINALAQQHQAAKTKLEELEARVKEHGGVTETPESFEATATRAMNTLDTKIKNAQKKLADAGELGDIEALPKLAARLDALKEERKTVGMEYDRQREVLRINAVPVGETIPLMADEEQPSVAGVKPEEAGAGPLRPAKQRRMMKAMQPDMFRSAEEEIERQKKIRNYKETPVGQQIPLFGPKLEPKQPSAVRPTEAGAGPLPKETEKAPIFPSGTMKLKDKTKLAYPSARLAEPFDLFSDYNILHTALTNRDPQVLAAMQRAQDTADRKARQSLGSTMTPREEVYEALKDRISGIVRRERNYDTYEYTDHEGNKREVHVTDAVAAEIKALRDKVEKPVTDKNGVVKRSMLQIAHDQFAGLEKLREALDEAKAANAPATKIATIEKRIKRVQAEYEKTLARIAPERAKLDAAMAKLYKTTVVQTPGQKEAELQALGTSKRSVSKEVKKAKKSTTAEVSLSAKGALDAALADVVREVGYDTEEYQKLAIPAQKKLDDKVAQLRTFVDTGVAKLAELKAKYGEDSKRYNNAANNFVKQKKNRSDVLDAFAKRTAEDLEAKAKVLGAASPALAEAQKKVTEEFKKREAPATAAQEPVYQRGTQATRKLAKAGEFTTASTESRERTAERQGRFEASLSEEKARQQNYEARTQREERKARAAAEPKTAVGQAMREAARNKIKSLVSDKKQVLASEKKQSDIQALAAYDTAETLRQFKEEGKYARGVEVTSKDLTPTQIQHLENNDIEMAMYDIYKDTSNDPLDRAIAEQLYQFLDQTDVELHKTLTDSEGKPTLGEAISTLVKLSREGGLSQEVLLHEGTHAAAERVVQIFQNTPEKLSPEQLVACKELQALYEAAKRDPNITSKNAKSSLSEFVAEVMSNKNLQEQLRKKKWKLSNAWNGFVSCILRAIGVKNVETMLGAAIQSVEAIMMPSSFRLEGAAPEIATNRKLAKKDIEALHTGSNSMKQFAAQFVDAIKTKDRTPEDVERIGNAIINDMIMNTTDYVPGVDPDEYYKSSLMMSDKQMFDPRNNLLHYVEADVNTWAVFKAVEEKPDALYTEAGAATQKRFSDFLDLLQYLKKDNAYTVAEQALVLKGAAKFAVIAGPNGRLRIAEISANNLHPIAVVGHDATRAVIEKLRQGLALKDAFLSGLQEVADKNAVTNSHKNGWQKFDQSDDYEKAVELNAGAANTPWCTGAQVSTAAGQLKDGDFYIYYKNGKPEVAVRMNGKDTIGEVRGNTANQGLLPEQEQIARDFLNKNQFKGADKFLDSAEKKRMLTAVLKEGGVVTPELLLRNNFTSADALKDSWTVSQFFNFSAVLGYSPPTPSTKIVVAMEKLVDKSFVAALEKGYLIDTNLIEGGNLEYDTLITTTHNGVVYEVPLSELKGLKKLTLSRQGTLSILPNLHVVQDLVVFNTNPISLPASTYIGEIDVYTDKNEGGDIALQDGTVVGRVHPCHGLSEITLRGNIFVNVAELLSRNNDNQILHLNLPDAQTVNIAPTSVGQLGANAANAATKIARRVAYAERTGKKGATALEMFVMGDGTIVTMDGEVLSANAEAADTAIEILDEFDKALGGEITEVLSGLNPRNTTNVAALISHATQEAFKKQGSIANMLQFTATFNKKITQAFEIPSNFLLVEELGTVNAPNRVTTPTKLRITEETPRYARTDDSVGVHTKEDGSHGFRAQNQPVAVAQSFVAKDASFKDKLIGNVTGLAGRVQFVDQYAALSAAFKKGVDANVVSDLEAQQAEFYLRFGQQASQYATQALTNGPLELRKGEGGGHIYASKPGANMIKVAEAVSRADVGNDTQTEAMLTAYLAGKRAEVVGWDKLNFTNPALAQREYNDVMRILNADKKAMAAFKEAAEIYQQYNNGQLDFLVQTGYLTAKAAAEMKKIPYIPFYRTNRNGDIELVIDKAHIVKLSNIKDEPQLQQLIGDNTQIQPVFTSAVQNTFLLTNIALRNQSVKDSAFLLKRMGIASALGEGYGPTGPDTIRFKVKGEDYFAKIDTDMYGIPAKLIVTGMEGIKTTLPAVFKLMGVPADVLRKFVTRAPTYALKQAFRDPLTAWMTTGTDGVPVLNSFKELASMVAGRSEVEAKLMASGAISSNVFTGDQRDMQKVLRELSTGKRGWSKVLAKLDAFAMQGDAATRAVVYKDSLNKGMSEMQALLRTLESMNFGRRGVDPSIQALSTIIPFFNAQIQGLDVLYRAFKGDMPYSEQLKIRQKLVARGFMLAAGTIAYAAMMQDDEAYKRAKPEERYGNWFIHIPGVEEPLKIPIPFELGILFKALPEAVFNAAATDEKAGNAAAGIGKLVALSNPFSLPQAVKPLTEVVLGKSFFSGDIESQREKNMLPEERYRETTTELSKLVGSVTGKAGIASPIQLDYLIRGYTGSLGIALVQLANPLLNSEAKADVAAPTTKASKMPFIGGLFQPVEGRGTLDEAYDRMQEIQQTKGTFNRLVEEGRLPEAQAFARDHIERLAAASISGSVQQRLGQYAKMRRQIISAPNLTTERKDELLKNLDAQQTKYASTFLEVTDRTTPQ